MTHTCPANTNAWMGACLSGIGQQDARGRPHVTDTSPASSTATPTPCSGAARFRPKTVARYGGGQLQRGLGLGDHVLPICAVAVRAVRGGGLAGENQHPMTALEDSCHVLGDFLAVPVLPSPLDSELHGQCGEFMTVRIVPLPLSVSNAYLLLGDRPVLVDAGRPGEEKRLLDALHQHGIGPSDLALVVLTHGHTDHAGSVNAVARAGVPIAIGAGDAGLLERGTNEQLPITGFPGRVLRPVITRMTFAGASPQVLVRDPLRLDSCATRLTRPRRDRASLRVGS